MRQERSDFVCTSLTCPPLPPLQCYLERKQVLLSMFLESESVIVEMASQEWDTLFSGPRGTRHRVHKTSYSVSFPNSLIGTCVRTLPTDVLLMKENNEEGIQGRRGCVCGAGAKGF